ncbi:MAG: HAMP domain-containing histidine kinase [Actinomycetota bacterium]|nr:HAMP domain-containing histidine kinase [Actinomycetota bacterium]
MSFPVTSPLSPDDSRWRYRRSLASRVILLTTMAVGLAVAFVAAGAYVTVRMQLQATLDDSLLERAHGAAKYNVLAETDVPPSLLGAADVRMAYVRADGRAFALDKIDPQLPLGDPELDVARGESADSVRTLRAGTEDYRVVAVPTSSGGASLVIAQSLEQQHSVLARLGIVMLGFGVVGVVVAGFAGWTVARNGLRPVRRLTTAVEAKARTEDLQPLDVEGDDEVARLAAAFNEMLIALDASRQRQRSLVADAGHELRTPLTSLRTNIDLLTQSDDTVGPTLEPEARAEVLDDIRSQIDELTTLIGDLTELARDDPPASVIEELELSEIVHQAFNRVRLRAPSLSFDVVAHPWWVVGDAAALERAVTNLLDNAAKWSPAGGRVSCKLVDGVLTVDDDGPGISEEDRPHVFDRFWRATESRTMPGSGLGLSIVRQVADRHSGTIEVGSSASGGARLVLTIPGSPTPAAVTAGQPGT